MFARRILVALVILTILGVYLVVFENKYALTIPGGMVFTLLILTWIFQHQINWWWYKRNPPRLPAPIHDLYSRQRPFYQSLSREEQLKFGERASLFVIDKEWIAMGPDNVPEDLKYIVAFYAIMLTWKKEDYLLTGYDRVVFYLHPFLTPHYKDQVHTYEVEHVDGTIILSTDHLTAGFMSPKTYYQTGLHAMAEAYESIFPGEYPGPEVWSVLESFGNISKSKVEEITGLNQDNPWGVAAHQWFTHGDSFRQRDNGLYERVGRLLGYGNG